MIMHSKLPFKSFLKRATNQRIANGAIHRYMISNEPHYTCRVEQEDQAKAVGKEKVAFPFVILIFGSVFSICAILMEKLYKLMCHL